MTLTLAKNPSWSVGEKFTSPQGNHLQNELIKAVDGVGGGTYTPSAPISIGGSGVQMTALLECQGDVVIDNLGSTNSLSVGGSASVGGNFASTGQAFFSGAAAQFAEGWTSAAAKLCTVNGDLVVGTTNSDELTVWAESFLNGDVNFAAGKIVTFNEGYAVAASKVSDWGSGATQVSSTGILVTGVASIVGTSNFTGAITIGAAAAVSLASIVTPTGIGRVKERIHVGTDANITVGIADGDIIVVPAFAANRTWTVTSTGAGDGDHFIMDATALTGAFDVQLVDDVAAPILVLKNNASGDQRLALFYFYSGAWRARVLDRTT